MEKVRETRDEDGDIVEIVNCRAMKCGHNMGRGKCTIVHSSNGDNLISIDSSGICANYHIPK